LAKINDNILRAFPVLYDESLRDQETRPEGRAAAVACTIAQVRVPCKAMSHRASQNLVVSKVEFFSMFEEHSVFQVMETTMGRRK
jgi:hypothetical protein